ncbi:twin-arginine translocase subunit TatC [Candidatus Magnetomonas plexicatena]|nr:twin-arginine translocase subunit TatC [Nitrospirales bacterium LBB_01]
MPFVEHLTELRTRLLVSFVTIFVIFIAVFNYSEYLFKILVLPMEESLVFKMQMPFISFVPKTTSAVKLVFLEPAEAFWMHLKLSMLASIVLALPVLFSQLWLFISPGLLPKEKKYVLPFIFSATILFMCGAFFCFIIVLPFALGFLLTYKTEHLTPMISVGHYVDFTMKFILAFGIIFEMPIIIIILTRLGIVTPVFLKKYRKHAIVMAFIIAGVVTPTPDAFNQTLMAVPMIVLYEIGIFVSKFFIKKPEENETKDVVKSETKSEGGGSEK